MELKLGRLPRKFDKRIPRVSAILAARKQLPPAPLTVQNTKNLPKDLGVMLNDRLGNCTCAGVYHARQIWTGVANPPMVTESDSNVLKLYEETCGYKPGDSSTDQGGIEQDVLHYLLNTGYLVGKGGARQKILGYAEVNVRNLDNLKRVIADCGVAYVGANIPQSVMDNADNPTIAWDYEKNNSRVVGGHCFLFTGYDLDTFTVNSWGTEYFATHAFLGQFLDEAYAIFDPSWIERTGKTPLGMKPADLSKIMGELKEAA